MTKLKWMLTLGLIPMFGGSVSGRPPTPEPSAVYGYVSLVDPTSGRRHLILDNSFVPPSPTGYPRGLTVVFKPTSGPLVRVTTAGASVGWQQAGGVPATAYMYTIRFIHDRSVTTEPVRVNDG